VVADLSGEPQVGEDDVDQRGDVVLAVARLDHLLLGFALLLPHPSVGQNRVSARKFACYIGKATDGTVKVPITSL